VIACEPATLGEMGWGLSKEVEAAVDRAVDVVLKTVGELRSDAAYAAEG
jgi:hypothetical protein